MGILHSVSKPLAALTLASACILGMAPGAYANPEATQKGVDLYRQHRYAEAKAVLSTAVSAEPKDATARAYLAMTLNNFDHDYDRAQVLLEEAVRLEPMSSTFHQWLGSVYGNKAGSSSVFKAPSYAKKCRQEMERGVELDPRDPDARESLMQFYLQAPGFIGGSVEKAREQAAAIAKLDACRGYLAEASIALRAKDSARAEAFYRKAIAAAPDRGGPYNGLAYFLLGSKRTDEALVVFRQYANAVPEDPNAHDSLAEGLLAQGRVDESLAEYEKALSLDPYFASSYLGVAQCRERKADWKRAREAYGRYLELVPKGRTSDRVREKLADLQSKG